MKTTFALLLTLLLLTSCATKPGVVRTGPLRPPPSAGVGFCRANAGVLVILVDNLGEMQGFACPDIGKKTTSQPSAPPPSLTAGEPIVLGKVTKFKGDDPDPCIEWVIGADFYYICW